MELTEGIKYRCKVVSIVKSGAVVELEDNSTCLIHLSNIAHGYVKDASNFVTVGDTYQALCIVGKVRPLELSLKHLKLSDKSTPTVNIITDHIQSNGNRCEPSKLDIMIQKCNQDLKQKMKQSAKRNIRR